MHPTSQPYRPEAPILPELASGAVVVLEDGSEEAKLLLLHHREEDRWCLPKGHVDPGESLGTAALREVREESGIERVRLGPELTEVRYRFYAPGRGVNVAKSCVYFLATVDRGELHLEATFDRASWVPFARALELVSFDSDRAVLGAAAEAVARARGVR